jgi:hypothetical protein
LVGSRLELVSRAFDALDRHGVGYVDRAALFAHTRGKSQAYVSYARLTFQTLLEASGRQDPEASARGERVTRKGMAHASDEELLVLLNPRIFDAFHALDLTEAGALCADAIERVLASSRVEKSTLARAEPLMRALLEACTAGGAVDGRAMIGRAALARLSDEELQLLERAGTEARRTGYVRPEDCETPIDARWDNRVIAEARGGGMNMRQAEILGQAIKWGF